jgi:hypothetical protein
MDLSDVRVIPKVEESDIKSARRKIAISSIGVGFSLIALAYTAEQIYPWLGYFLLALSVLYISSVYYVTSRTWLVNLKKYKEWRKNMEDAEEPEGNGEGGGNGHGNYA